MKNLKRIISILLAITLIAAAFAACKNSGKKSSETVTVAVTDENGETVTDKDGKVVTEVVESDETSAASQGEAVVIDKNNSSSSGKSGGSSKKSKSGGSSGKSSSDGKSNGKKTTKKNSSKSDDNKNTITKPAAPSAPSDLKATDIKKDSLTLSWKGVKCDAYELQYKKTADTEWKTAQEKMTSTKAEFKEVLDPYTEYEFRVRAFNENNAGKSASDWISTKATTKEDDKYKRKIKIDVALPFDSKTKDTLRIYVKQSDDKKETLVEESEVECDGTVHSFTTKDEFKGVVTVRAELVNHKASSSVKTNGDSCSLEIATGIDMEYDNL